MNAKLGETKIQRNSRDSELGTYEKMHDVSVECDVRQLDVNGIN